MEKISLMILVILLIFPLCSCEKRVDEPSNWTQMGSIHIGLKGSPHPSRVNLPHNSYKQIFKELQDPRIMQMVTASAGCNEKDFEDITIIFNDKEIISINIYLTGNNEEVFDIIHDKLDYYVENRLSGHTKKFLLASLDNQTNQNVTDKDLENLLKLYPDLPTTWVKKVDEKIATINSQEVRIVNFVVIDDAIAWNYSLHCYQDGSFKNGWGHKYDAKDYDPKYDGIMERINQKVNEKMERENIKGLGSCHAFWEYKKKFLKKEGIKWRSPSELNPGIMFD